MNRNILIAIVVILVVGGVVMVQNNSKNQSTTPSVQTQTPSAEEGDAKMEKSETEPSDSGDKAEEKDEKENVVTMTSSGFEPQTITIKAGEEVVWVNKSGGVGTVDSADHPTHLKYSPLNLGSFQDGEEHELVFDKPGTYGFHDHLHPNRFGKVVVE